MEPILSFCGMRCDLCLAYRPNITAHPENRQRLSDGWHKYFGFRIPPEEIRCDGCRATESATLDKECPVRPCAIARELEHCAQCEDYICENLQGILVDFESIQQKYDQPIPQADRQRFILPYENAQRLSNLRGHKK
jgi:hypothetical protein